MLAPGIRRAGYLFQPSFFFAPAVMSERVGADGASGFDGITALAARTLTLAPGAVGVRGTVGALAFGAGASLFLPKLGRSRLISGSLGTLGRLILGISGIFGSFTCRAVGARASWRDAASDTAHSKAPVVAGPVAAVKAGESMA